jgi:tetratricopeptide (TPR) repeat protein
MNSVDNLFDKYYTSNKTVTIKQLVGTQYYNDGIYLMQDENFEEAIQQLEKSIALYPSITTAQILMSLYLKELSTVDYSKEIHVDYLERVIRYKELNVDIEEGVVGEFGQVADYHLIEKRDTTFFKLFYAKFYPLFKDETIVKRLDYIFFGAMGEYHFNELEYKEAGNYFLKALNLVGDTNNLENLYMRSVVLQITGMNNFDEALILLNNAQNNYSDLGKNKMFMTTKVEVVSLLMMRSFERNRIKEGEKYRAKLEGILDNVEVKINETNIGIAYAEAGSAYYRLGSKSKARTMFKKGLSYCPNHYELEYRLGLISY